MQIKDGDHDVVTTYYQDDSCRGYMFVGIFAVRDTILDKIFKSKE